MPEKQIKAKIISRTDTQANWAVSTYVPAQGEIIVYTNAGEVVGVKVGDGVHLPNALAFVGPETIPTGAIIDYIG